MTSQMPRSTERLSGVWALLGPPRVLALLRRAIGARAAQRELADRYVDAAPGARVLDLGCGLGGIYPHLPRGVTFCGIDLNSDYVDWASQIHGGSARFQCGNAAEFRPEFAARFDLVMARGLLHHLNDADAGDMIANASRYLAPGGVFVTMDPVRVAGQNPITRVLIAMDRGKHIRTGEQYGALLSAGFGHVEAHLRTDLLRIPYSHLIHLCIHPKAAAA